MVVASFHLSMNPREAMKAVSVLLNSPGGASSSHLISYRPSIIYRHFPIHEKNQCRLFHKLCNDGLCTADARQDFPL